MIKKKPVKKSMVNTIKRKPVVKKKLVVKKKPIVVKSKAKAKRLFDSKAFTREMSHPGNPIPDDVDIDDDMDIDDEIEFEEVDIDDPMFNPKQQAPPLVKDKYQEIKDAQQERERQKISNQAILKKTKFDPDTPAPGFFGKWFNNIERKKLYDKFGLDNNIRQDKKKLGRYWLDDDHYIDVNVLDPRSVQNAEKRIDYVRNNPKVQEISQEEKDRRRRAAEAKANPRIMGSQSSQYGVVKTVRGGGGRKKTSNQPGSVADFERLLALQSGSGGGGRYIVVDEDDEDDDDGIDWQYTGSGAGKRKGKKQVVVRPQTGAERARAMMNFWTG